MQFASERMEVADVIEAEEYFFRENMTDGLPVTPPTEDRVREFLEAIALPPDGKIAEITERASVITAEKLAINAVMAGCLPEYMPVLAAAVEGLADPAFKFNHLASVGSPWPMMIVSGPIVNALKMDHGRYLFGSGNRANATMGRAISLLLWNCCEMRPDAIQGGDLGNAGRHSMCIAENPDTAWEGMNEWEGYDKATSTVTVSSGYQLCMCRSQCSEAEGILAPLVNALSQHEFSPGCIVVTIPPSLEELLVQQGWTKRRIRDYIFEHCRRSVKSLKETGRWARWGARVHEFAGQLGGLVPPLPGDEERWVYMFRRNPDLDPYVFPEGALNRRGDILIVAAGGQAGQVIGFYQPYSQSTAAVTKPIRLAQHL